MQPDEKVNNLNMTISFQNPEWIVNHPGFMGCTKNMRVFDHNRFKRLFIQKNACIHPWSSWNPSLASKVF